MSPIEITFATPTQPGFRWLDSFKCLTEEEIEIFIVILRGALAAFSAELADRREPSRDQTLEKYKKMLQETARQINEQGLTRIHEGYLDRLNESLAHAGSAQSKKSRAVRQYLLLISNVIGWPYVLLIYCALGKHKVELLNEDQQVQLVKYMAEHRESLFCCRLKDSVIQRQFQDKHIKVNLPLTRGSRKRKRRESTDGDLNIETRDQQSVSLAGIVKVARESILKDAASCPPICKDEKYNFDGESRTTPATNPSASNTQARTLPDTGTLPILRDRSGITIDNNGQIESATNTEHQLRLAGPNTVVSGLDTKEVDSVSAVRCSKWIRPNCQPMVRLAQDGLIKIQSSSLTGDPGSLQDFYVHSICAGRTLLKDNAYLQEVLPIANCDAVTKCAMIALALSYYKEYLPDGSIQKEWMKKREVEAITRTIMALKENTRNGYVYRDTAKMLLIHHAILNQNIHSVHWTDYLYQLQDSHGQQSNLIIATHSILLMTLLPLSEKHRFQTFNYDWIGHGEHHSLTKVNGIIGMSRKMVFFQYLITTAAKFPKVLDNRNLLRDIEASVQWLDVTETEMAMRIALKTAETYKLATRLYALARLCRFTPSHPDVRAICNRLTRELYELPASGAEYSGLHPAWCFPIACACTEDLGEYAKMDRILENIGSTNKSNVSDLLRLVRWIWKWKMGRQLSEEWWEDMTEYLDSVMNGNLVCVT